MAKRIATAGGNAAWTPGERLVARLTGYRSIKVEGEDRKILEFKKQDGSTAERWSSFAFDSALASGAIKFGDVLDVTSYPKRGKGKKQFCPFDISVLETSDPGYF